MKVKAFNRRIKGYFFIQKFDENGKHEFIMNPENTLEDPGYIFHVQLFKTASEAESYINSAVYETTLIGDTVCPFCVCQVFSTFFTSPPRRKVWKSSE